MTEQDWIDAGYRRYPVRDRDRNVFKLADFLLQKRIVDEDGIKYYITVYCYDRTKYPVYDPVEPSIGFMPTAHLTITDDGPFFSVEMNGIDSGVTIEEIEKWFDKFWVTTGSHHLKD